MSLRLERSSWFIGDLEHYAAWYTRKANWDLAERYLRAVAATLRKIADLPTLGHRTRFAHPELANLRCIRVESPFQKHLIFYHWNETTVQAERVVHGSRDLQERLRQAPGSDDY